jgi:hypothetical protein
VNVRRDDDRVIRTTQPIGPMAALKESIANPSGPIEATISVSQGKALQAMLCVPATGDFGAPGSDDATRAALRQFRTAFLYDTPLPSTVPDTITSSVVRDQLFTTLRKFPSCNAAGFQNAYEVGIFSKLGFPQIRSEVARALQVRAQVPVPTGLIAGGDTVDPILRDAIVTLRKTFGGSGAPSLDPQFYDWIAQAGDRK